MATIYGTIESLKALKSELKSNGISRFSSIKEIKAFSCPEEKNAEDALINIVDEIIIFKNNSGNIYMPEFSFNGIGDLIPGHGYQIKVTDYILDFNICEWWEN